MNVLLVEDDDPKRKNIRAALARILPEAVITEAKSVNAALRYLRQQIFDLTLLDMSLPSFDVGPDEPGGRPQGFGGIEVLRSMDRLALIVPVIVITAYEAFPSGGRQITIETLTSDLAKAHPSTFRGLVFYNSVFANWADDLGSQIREAIVKK
jgi:CheY-like chemotaxis protein